ncbi:response regulator [Pseudoalteromonas piscicida]|uniref:response regulator n=1 Tax=Pseudoalteromonas piscicida TaxID=43662 RepID=UPI0027E410B8|nr:response regulator [Pseudoalteromonas piscicida]WMO15694.1 response regulator [Pseudoalteromonas piscicida]
MKILLVEDGDYKSQRVLEYINTTFENIEVLLACSYSSGVKSLVANKPDLVILDMSLPTFDMINGQGGGEKRMYGGLDIARQIQRRKVNSPFVFLTQHRDFTENPKLEKLSDIDEEAKSKYGSLYLGYIFYEHAGFEWKDKLKDVLGKYA